MRIFVLHYNKLVERKQHIIEQFQKHGIVDYEFVEMEMNRDELVGRDIIQNNLRNSQIDLLLRHFYVYKQISEKYEHGLIFEDDVILADDFVKRFNKYVVELPNDYDMLFLGDGCHLHIEPHKLIHNKHIYEKCLYPTNWGGDGATRCTDSYLISQKCAIQLCYYIDHLSPIDSPIDFPIDWWLNVACRDNLFKVYWAEPTIVTQGTLTGFFTSSTH